MPDPADHAAPARVREVYDEIAGHFSETRHHPWPEVTEFLTGKSGSVGLDVGCGNGRHTAALVDHVDRAVGLDLSRELLLEARDRSRANDWDAALAQGDAATLPLKTDSVDVAVYVATLHHLRDRETRRRSLDELARVLTADGSGLVSAWSTAADRFDADDQSDGFDTTIDWTLPGGETVPRFYHIYAPSEFEADLSASDLQIRDWRVSSGNCYAEVEGKRP